MNKKQRERAVFELLVTAMDLRAADRERAHAFRNGVLSAYALFTGQDEETVYESAQEALQARHERRIAEEG